MSATTAAAFEPTTGDRRSVVLAALEARGDLTGDEFVAGRFAIHAWSGVFTALHREGLIAFTGESRPTRLGGRAKVHTITPAGREYLAATRSLVAR